MTAQPSVLIVGGEASADEHGARLMAALREKRPDLTIFGIGGPAMRAEGLEVIAPAEAISIAGLTEVLFALPRIWGILRRLTEAAVERRPAVAVLIDLPDFNLRLAKRLKRLGIPVIYYIGPQVWAWRPSRVAQLKELVAQMLVVLPFEQAYLQERGVRVRFVGHPLLDTLPQSLNRSRARTDLGLPPTQGPVVALLPGSRAKEVSRHLPLMLRAVQLLKRRFPDIHPLIPVAGTISRAKVDAAVRRAGLYATVVEGRAQEALVAADVAVVCSGTSTLLAALLARPMVVVYRVSWLSYQILKRLVKVAHIALVNLIAGRTLVPELIQAAFTAENVEKELVNLLADPVARVHLTQQFTVIKKQLGSPGVAGRVAEVIAGYLPEPSPPAEDGEPPTRGKLWG